MNYLLYIGPIVVLIIGALLYFKRISTPPAAIFSQISDTMAKLQAVALAHVSSASKGPMFTGSNEQQMERQTATVAGTVRFIYTIEEYEGGYLHTVSSQLTARRPKKYQIQCMLIVMLFFQQQLKEIEINPDDVEFGMEESELNTQYVLMKLTTEQHSRLRDSI